MSQDLLDPILRSPILPDLVSKLSQAMEKESEARRKFLEEITPETKAEFILGEVCLHSPARALHLEVTLNLATALHQFAKVGRKGTVYAEKCLVSLTRNDLEPDIVWFSDEKASLFTPDQMRFPAPDLVVEVLSESTESRDRGIKFEDYALHGVSEYWIVSTDDNTIEQYRLDPESKVFVLHEKLAHGTIRSLVVEAFEMELSEIF